MQAMRKVQRVQDNVPIEEIYTNGMARQKVGPKVEGALFITLEIRPPSLGLLDEKEKAALCQAFHAFLLRLAGPIFFYARDATPDLSAYLEALRTAARETPSPRLHAAALEQYGHLRSLLSAQKVREKRYYLVLPYQPQRAQQKRTGTLSRLFSLAGGAHPPRAGQADALAQQAKDLAAHLTSIGLPTRFTTREGVLNLWRAAYDPTRPPITFAQATRALVSGEVAGAAAEDPHE